MRIKRTLLHVAATTTATAAMLTLAAPAAPANELVSSGIDGRPVLVSNQAGRVIYSVNGALYETVLYDPSDPEANTGDNDLPTAEQFLAAAPYIADAPAPLAAKVENAARVAVYLAQQPADDTADDGTLYVASYDRELFGGAVVAGGPTVCLSTVAADPCDDNEIPARAKISNALATLHRQETGYTCAPASVRSVIHSMTNTNLTEASLADEMNTSSSVGTYWPEVKKALNNHQDHDTFVGQPEYSRFTADEFMSRVVYDVAINRNKKHSVVPNVNQRYLPYWNRTRNGRHYLTAYGYDLDAKRIVFGDVARHVFGEHSVRLSQATEAVVKNKGLVIW